MFLRKQFFCLLSISCVIVSKKTVDETTLQECRTLYYQLLSHVDWPIQINCSSLIGGTVQGRKCDDITSSTSVIVQVHVIEDGVSFATVKEGVTDDICDVRNITFRTIDYRSEPWIDKINYEVIRNISLRFVSYRFREEATLPCIAPVFRSDWITFPPPAPYTTTWRVSSRKERSNSSVLYPSHFPYLKKLERKRIKSNKQVPPPLEIYRMTFLDPGVYSCEVGKWGRRAFVVHYSVCVKNVQSTDPPVLSCPKRVRFTSKENVVVNCSALISNDEIKDNEIKVVWTKNMAEESICSKPNQFQNDTETNSHRINCGWTDPMSKNLQCIDYKVKNPQPIIKQLTRSVKTMILMKVTNATHQDAGLYEVKLRVRKLWSKSSSVLFVYDDTSKWGRIRTALLVSLGALLIMITLGYVLWNYRIRILLFKRRYFDNPGKGREKEFEVNLIYYIGEGMENGEIEDTRTIVTWTRGTLTNLRYKFLDSQEKFQPGFLHQNSLSNIVRSQLLLIILTQSFINDSNSRFIVQQGCEEVKKNRTKLIVVTTPGAIKSLRKGNKTFSKQILLAVKTSRVIHWKQSMREGRFKDALEYALPRSQIDCSSA